MGAGNTDGTPSDPFLDLNVFKTLVIKFTIDGKTIVDSKNVMDFYAQAMFVPAIPHHFGTLENIIYFQSIGVLGGPLSPGKHVLKLDVKNTIPAFGAMAENHNTFNISVPPRITPPTGRYKGKG